MRGFSRRKLLASGVGAAAVAAASPALAAVLPTPSQSMGPFYPVRKPVSRDADLTRVDGRPGRAQGEILHVYGRVTAPDGTPIAGAAVEIWQANSSGRYDHPRANRARPLDPNFQGFGRDLTDADGAYRFLTIRPAPYPASAGWTRPPHIHFRVTAPDFSQLVTQMYFQGDPLNARDYILNGIGDRRQRQRLIVPFGPPPPGFGGEGQAGRFDIVLGRGRGRGAGG